jgi:hypothetical protein
MTENKAFLLLVAAGLVFEAVWILGMAALGAGSDLLVFGLIIPVVAVSYLTSCVVMHYGSEADDRKR